MSTLTRPRTVAASLAAVVALGGLAACGSGSSASSSATTTGSGSLTVTGAWARESAMASGDGALYFTVTNSATTDDELTAVAVPTDVAASAQMHETVTATDDTMAGGMATGTTAAGGDAMMTMREVASVPVPAGGTVTFEPGGHHVMLVELPEPLRAGRTFPVTLTFATAGTVEVTATVRAS